MVGDGVKVSSTMRIAYLDCASGISGDMTLGALVDAGASLEAIEAGVMSLGLPGVRLRRAECKKKGFRATQITIEHEPEHKHRHLHHIVAMIEQGSLSDRAKDLAKRIFGRLAEAEARVHGTTIQKVHFHEVGAVDSIADIVGAAIGWDLLGIERAVASPTPTGTGFVEIAHGRCSIPAPATAELLRGVPLAASSVPHELTTPTGASILATLVGAFGPAPAMTIDAIGYGAGQRDLEEQPNLLRILLGHADDASSIRETLTMLETNLDNTTGEMIGHATSLLWEAGALDVFSTAIQMKKNRPGVMLSALCEPMLADRLEAILFNETTTLGVRRQQIQRHKLRREKRSVQTAWGPIEGMVAWIGSRVGFSPEFESCREAAIRHGVPLKQILHAAQRAFPEQA